jgi:hypothetical protein
MFQNPQYSSQQSESATLSEHFFNAALEQTTAEERAALQYRDLWIQAARDVYQNHTGVAPSTQIESKILGAARPGNAVDLSTQSADGAILGDKGALQKSLAEELGVLLGEDAAAINKKLTTSFVQVLAQQPWVPIEHEFAGTVAATPSRGVTRLTPLNEAYAPYAMNASEFEQLGTRGISSSSLKLPTDKLQTQDNNPVPNGWLSQLWADDGRLLLEGFRTATLVSYGERDSIHRETATAANMKHLVQAVALREFNLRTESEQAQVLANMVTLPVRIASFDLQTWVGEDSPFQKFSVERETIEEQRAAFEGISGPQRTTWTTTASDGTNKVQEISIDVEVITFNFPVHELSLREGIGWDEQVARHNNKSLDILKDSVQSSFQELADQAPSEDTQVARKLELLQASLTHQLTHESYRSTENNPYLLNATLINLAYLSGYQIHFNCRSGKDRTGFLDGEAKLLALKLDTPGVQSQGISCDGPNTEAEKELLYEILTEGGGRTVQQLNSGVPGSKLKPILKEVTEEDPLVARIGATRWSSFKGLSRYAST